MSGPTNRAREIAHWQALAFHARSFRWASAFLNRSQRRRVAALYAFCRAVDDLADGDWVTADARRDLESLQAAIAAEPNGEGLWPEGYLWFRELCIECGIDFRIVRELLIGMTSDTSTVRLQTDRDLVRYCYRAAGTVGVMMCSVLGVRDARAWRHAVDLGIAMQMTNICRDVREDAAAERVYLPADRLAAYGATPEQLVQGEADPEAVSVVVNDLIGVAERYYRSGDAGMRYLSPRPRWAVLVASRLYRAIGRRLRRRYEGNAMLGRVVVPWFVKLALIVPATLSWVRLSLWPARGEEPGPERESLCGLPYSGVVPPRPVSVSAADRPVLPIQDSAVEPVAASVPAANPSARVFEQRH